MKALKWVVAKLLQGDKSASPSSMELCDPWIPGPLPGNGLRVKNERVKAAEIFSEESEIFREDFEDIQNYCKIQ